MLDQAGLRDLLLAIDEHTYKHAATGDATDYTVWSPYTRRTQMTDDAPDEVMVAVQIDRMQTRPGEAVINQIIDALDAAHVPMHDFATDHDPGAIPPQFRWILTVYVRR